MLRGWDLVLKDERQMLIEDEREWKGGKWRK